MGCYPQEIMRKPFGPTWPMQRLKTKLICQCLASSLLFYNKHREAVVSASSNTGWTLSHLYNSAVWSVLTSPSSVGCFTYNARTVNYHLDFGGKMAVEQLTTPETMWKISALLVHSAIVYSEHGHCAVNIFWSDLLTNTITLYVYNF